MKKFFAQLYAKWYLLIIIAAIVTAALLWRYNGEFGSELVSSISPRHAEAIYFGKLPAPTSPSLSDPVTDMVPKASGNVQMMQIHAIPAIKPGAPMVHPFVGDCTNCHLLIGGAPAGSQPKTPVGAVLEEISTNVGKMGPPIRPNSHRPHPAAGRCIKCHNLVVKVPVTKKKGGFIWNL